MTVTITKKAASGEVNIKEGKGEEHQVSFGYEEMKSDVQQEEVEAILVWANPIVGPAVEALVVVTGTALALALITTASN